MRLSAGAMSFVCPIMQVPISPTIRRELRGRHVRAEAGNGLELVERSAGVSEPATAHHRHRYAARGDERREADRDLVADAARRVLVDLRAGHRREIEDAPRMQHRLGERDRLDVVEAAEEHRHQERRHLVVGERTVGERGDQTMNLRLGKGPAVALRREDLHERSFHGEPS